MIAVAKIKRVRERRKHMDLLKAKDVAELLDIGKTKAYEVIRQLNKELEEKGYLTVPNKVPRKYLMERFYS